MMLELIVVREFAGDGKEAIKKTHKISDNIPFYSLGDALDAAEKFIQAEDVRRKKTPYKGPVLNSVGIIREDGTVLDDSTVHKLAKKIRD
jgi:hypothetical protein